jgi:hypothetical protein
MVVNFVELMVVPFFSFVSVSSAHSDSSGVLDGTGSTRRCMILRRPFTGLVAFVGSDAFECYWSLVFCKLADLFKLKF